MLFTHGNRIENTINYLEHLNSAIPKLTLNELIYPHLVKNQLDLGIEKDDVNSKYYNNLLKVDNFILYSQSNMSRCKEHIVTNSRNWLSFDHKYTKRIANMHDAALNTWNINQIFVATDLEIVLHDIEASKSSPLVALEAESPLFRRILFDNHPRLFISYTNDHYTYHDCRTKHSQVYTKKVDGLRAMSFIDAQLILVKDYAIERLCNNYVIDSTETLCKDAINIKKYDSSFVIYNNHFTFQYSNDLSLMQTTDNPQIRPKLDYFPDVPRAESPPTLNFSGVEIHNGTYHSYELGMVYYTPVEEEDEAEEEVLPIFEYNGRNSYLFHNERFNEIDYMQQANFNVKELNDPFTGLEEYDLYQSYADDMGLYLKTSTRLLLHNNNPFIPMKLADFSDFAAHWIDKEREAIEEISVEAESNAELLQLQIVFGDFTLDATATYLKKQWKNGIWKTVGQPNSKKAPPNKRKLAAKSAETVATIPEISVPVAPTIQRPVIQTMAQLASKPSTQEKKKRRIGFK